MPLHTAVRRWIAMHRHPAHVIARGFPPLLAGVHWPEAAHWRAMAGRSAAIREAHAQVPTHPPAQSPWPPGAGLALLCLACHIRHCCASHAIAQYILALQRPPNHFQIAITHGCPPAVHHTLASATP